MTAPQESGRPAKDRYLLREGHVFGLAAGLALGRCLPAALIWTVVALGLWIKSSLEVGRNGKRAR